MAQPLRATLDEIISAVPISPLQSASITCEIALRLERWIRAKRPAGVVVPGLQDIIVAQSGSIWWWRGRSVASSQVIPAVGALLHSILRHAPAGRTPAGLLYIVARAIEPGHLAPFRDLNELHAALARYGGERRTLAVDTLLARYQIARSGLPPLGEDSSISDVRRLRRAGGVALSQIASDTGIPISVLRELEWGVYTNWDLAHAGAMLASYAERAGLDAEAVTQVVLREQTVASVESWDTDIEATVVPRSHGFLPFAIAASLLATVLIATPGDLEPQAQIPTPMTAHGAASAPVSVTVTPAAPVPAPAVTSPSAPVRTTHPLPRRTGVVAARSQSRLSARRSQPTAGPVVRFARALIGDGRYRAEPFPKPK